MKEGERKKEKGEKLNFGGERKRSQQQQLFRLFFVADIFTKMFEILISTVLKCGTVKLGTVK